MQYVGSCITKFRARFNNYKSCNKLHKTQVVNQHNLHAHFDLPGHSSFADFEFTLIDQGDNLECVRKRERFWQYKLDTFLPKGLNEREVVTQGFCLLFFCTKKIFFFCFFSLSIEHPLRVFNCTRLRQRVLFCICVGRHICSVFTPGMIYYYVSFIHSMFFILLSLFVSHYIFSFFMCASCLSRESTYS